MCEIKLLTFIGYENFFSYEINADIPKITLKFLQPSIELLKEKLVILTLTVSK